MAMSGQNAGLTIVRNVNTVERSPQGRSAWGHVEHAMRRERARPQTEIEADYGAGDRDAIGRSLTRIEQARRTARGRAVPF